MIVKKPVYLLLLSFAFSTSQAVYLEWNPGGEGMIAATASSYFTSANIGALLPEYTVNGAGMNPDDTHQCTWQPIHWVADNGDSQSCWIKFEFDKAYRLAALYVWNYNHTFSSGNELDRGMRKVRITYSQDDVNYSELGVYEFAQATGENNYACNTVVDFEGNNAKYVTLAVVYDPVNPMHNWGDPSYTGLSEIRFTRLSDPVCGDPGTVYLAGDLNKNCYIDLEDLVLLLSNWLKCSDPANIECDL